MPEYPLVCVVTPTQDSEQYLRDCIDSVRRQDHPNIEHIIVDKSTTTATERIAKSYGNDVIFVRQEGAGLARAINQGLKLSSACYATWLGSDDTYLPGAISWAVRAFSCASEPSVVFGDSLFTDPHNNPLFRSTTQGFNQRAMVVDCRNPIAQPSSFVRMDLFKRLNYLDEDLHYFFDWDLWMRAGSIARFHYEPVLLSTYRLRDDSLTGRGGHGAELKRVWDKFWAGKVPAHIKPYKHESYANMYSRSAEYYSASGDYGNAALAKFRKWLRRYEF